MTNVFLSIATLLFMPTIALAAPTIALQSDVPAQFTIPSGQFSTSYYIDVAAGAAQLRVNLDNLGTGDTDLMLRKGTPFADLTFGGAAPDFDLFLRYAHYRSFSGRPDENIVVQQSSTIPLGSGRWYVAVLNSANSAQTVRLTATVASAVAPKSITLVFNQTASDCQTAPWFDATVVTPVGDNPGTTRGEQRRNALTRAATLLTEQLQPPVPIVVQACWSAEGGSPSTGATIAFAGPNGIIVDNARLSDGSQLPSPWLPEKYTWYAITQAVRLSGTDQCSAVGGSCSEPDIVATFNSDIDPPNTVVRQPFYYGYTSAAKPPNTIDFISTAMHEMTHGLGFLGFVSVDPADGPIGERQASSSGDDYDDIFDKKIVSVDTLTRAFKPFLGLNTSDADRAAAMVSGDGLRWSDAEAANSPINVNNARTAPDNFPLLFAPCEGGSNGVGCTTLPGSTLSHTVQPDDLMNAYDNGMAIRTMGLAGPMLDAIGWSNAAAPTRTYTQPIPNNWFDRLHNGHGIDFQLFARDPINGDIYFLIFYTYDAQGKPEWYQSAGRLIDGVFIGGKDANGIALARVIYDPVLRKSVLDTTVQGDVTIDFNQAATSPTCRRGDRGGAPALAVMRWKLRTESASWCIEPAIPAANRTTPDYSGHWFAGGGDAGWGLELFTINSGGPQPLLVGYMYYPDQQGNSRWVGFPVTQVDLANTPTMDLNERTTGFCRLCDPPPGTPQTRKVGTIKFNLTSPQRTDPPSNANRVTFSITLPEGGGFSRQDVPITFASQPPGG
ncbi:MAG: hypothetical protein ABI411_15240 [Tahibacter sp.]